MPKLTFLLSSLQSLEEILKIFNEFARDTQFTEANLNSVVGTYKTTDPIAQLNSFTESILNTSKFDQVVPILTEIIGNRLDL